MVITDAGLLIYGGTQWSITNYTIQDAINSYIGLYSDLCRQVINDINLNGSKYDNEWIPISPNDIGNKRWYQLWQET